MKSKNEINKSTEIGSRPKKRISSQGIQSVLGYADCVGDTLLQRKNPHPDWVHVPDAKNKFSKIAQAFYEQRYPGCKVTFGVRSHENLRFHCDKALDVYFRVQMYDAYWPMDTLVISKIYDVYEVGNNDPLLELVIFLIFAQKEIGYFNVGLESPGKHMCPLIKRFGFEKLDEVDELDELEEIDELEGRWTISIAALKDRIDAGMKRR